MVVTFDSALSLKPNVRAILDECSIVGQQFRGMTGMGLEASVHIVLCTVEGCSHMKANCQGSVVSATVA